MQIDLPFTYEELLADLENENWINPSVENNLGNDNWGATRFKVMHPKKEHKLLRSLHHFFNSDEFKRVFVEELYNNDPGFDFDWEWTPEEMCNHTMIHGEFSKDLPGFYNDLHTDYRKLVGTGLVYWAKANNPDVCSVFYDSREKISPVVMTTDFGHGWMHGNCNDTYHEGWNRTDRPRYSSLIGLTLNVTPVSKRG
jgi:hypothetical protein